MIQKSLKFTLLLSLLALTFVYAMFQGGFVSWFLFYSFLPFALYSLMLMMYPMSRLEVERRVEKKSDESLVGHITIKRKIPFPLLFLMVEDVLPKQLAYYYGMDTCKIMVYPLFRRSISIQYELEEVPRGEHIFQEIRLQTSDFLGFVNRECQYQRENTYLVYPKIVEIKPYRLTSTFESGELNSAFSVQQEHVFMSGIREYQAGDQLSWIDWKATARKDVLISKEFESKQTNTLCVVLDGMTREGFEERVIFGASLAAAYEKLGVDNQFLTVDTASISEKSYHRDHSLYTTLHQLAKIQPDDEAHFSYALRNPLIQFDEVGLVIVVISTLTNDLITALQQTFHSRVKVILCVIKENSVSLTKEEKAIEWELNRQRYYVSTLHKKDFANALIEVSRR